MFGDNKITKPYQAGEERGTLKMVEFFYTIQGEGPDAGRPAMFLRLSHCNLRCWFCDTDFEKGQIVNLMSMVAAVSAMSVHKRCNLLVITGGEPLLQDIAPLVRGVNAMGIAVSVETAGTTYSGGLDELFNAARSNGNLIVCSPKTAKINPQLIPLIGAYKYIIKAGETGAGGIPNTSTQHKGKVDNIYLPADYNVPIYVQACDEYDDDKNKANLEEAAETALRYGYRLSVQMHKLAGLR